MKTYVGIDLHSTNSYFAVVDESGKRLFHKRIQNDKDLVMNLIKRIEQYGEISSLVIESTYNWYWLVDLLQENAYDVLVHSTNSNLIRVQSNFSYNCTRIHNLICHTVTMS